jgi:uncharacterized protein YggE
MQSRVLATASGKRIGWLLGGAAIGVMSAVVLAPSFGPGVGRAADATPPEHTISVSGTGRVLVKPDVADISLGVHIERNKAKDSETAAAEAMGRIIAALKAAGVADADIQTANISLQPTYDYSSSKQSITGYATDNLVSITVRDLTKLGDTVDAAVDAGATQVNGITFRVDNQSAVEVQARTAAMKDAKAKADALAQAAGVNITGVASISEVSSPTPYPVYFGKDSAAAGVPAAVDRPSTPVQPGQVTLEVTITVTYLIP